MALTTVSSDRLSTNVKNTNFTAAEKQDLTDDILPLAGQLGNRNLIINGAMQVAQRGTSSTSSGYQTVDRFKCDSVNTDEIPTQAQVDVAAGTTPYTLGFRKAFKITNGNQTSGQGTTDRVEIIHNIEAQDIANSGWNYLSSSSYITLQFWIKSSVAQNFYGRLLTSSGTDYNYPFETGSLTANTWTKITKTIPGNSGITVDNTNDHGLRISLYAGLGTQFTGSVSLNAWGAYNSTTRVPDITSTWYTTNDATLEITGVQLEVGSVATDFEHKSFGQELQLCQRYFYEHLPDGGASDPIASGTMSYAVRGIIQFPVRMRTDPSIVASNFTNAFYFSAGSSFDYFDTMVTSNVSTTTARIQASGNVSNPSDGVGVLFGAESTSAKLGFSAEL